jgi:hypothetical protein
MFSFENFNLNQTCSNLAGQTDFEAARILFFKLSFLPVMLIILIFIISVIVVGASGGFKKKTWIFLLVAIVLSLIVYTLSVVGFLPYFYNFNPSIT